MIIKYINIIFIISYNNKGTNTQPKPVIKSKGKNYRAVEGMQNKFIILIYIILLLLLLLLLF